MAEKAGEAAGHAEGHAAIVGTFNVEQVATACAFAGIIVGIALYVRNLPAREGWDLTKWSSIRLSARNQFGYDETMVSAGVDGGRVLGTFAWKQVDAGLIDGVVNDVGKAAAGGGMLLRLLQTGFVRTYALMMLVGVVGILAYAITHLGGKV